MANSKPIIDENGNKRWLNKKGQYHRENGPAIISKSNGLRWCINNQSHRIDGPSDCWHSGDKSWYLNDKFIRKFEYD